MSRYLRCARVIAKADGKVDIATLADRAFVSESTAQRCLQAYSVVVQALVEVGRLPDPAKKASAAKKAPKVATKTKPPAAATEKPAPSAETVETPAT